MRRRYNNWYRWDENFFTFSPLLRSIPLRFCRWTEKEFSSEKFGEMNEDHCEHQKSCKKFAYIDTFSLIVKGCSRVLQSNFTQTTTTTYQKLFRHILYFLTSFHHNLCCLTSIFPHSCPAPDSQHHSSIVDCNKCTLNTIKFVIFWAFPYTSILQALLNLMFDLISKLKLD